MGNSTSSSMDQSDTSTSILSLQLDNIMRELSKHGEANQAQAKLIQECHKQLKIIEKKAEHSSAESKTKEAIQAVGKALSEGVKILDAYREGDTSSIVQSVLALISSLSNISLLIDPITGVSIVAVCTVLSTILGITMAKEEESLLSHMRRVIHEELQQFKMELMKARVAGLMGLGEVLISELNLHLQELLKIGKTTYKGFDSKRFDVFLEYMSELKHVAEGKMFQLAEEDTDKKIDRTDICRYTGSDFFSEVWVKKEFSPAKIDREKRITELYLRRGRRVYRRGYSEQSPDPRFTTYRSVVKNEKQSEQHARQCLTCFVGYANIATLYITLLTLHVTLSRKAGLPVHFLNHKLENITDQAKKLFSFFPEADMLGPAGWWKGTLRVMVEYRKTPHFTVPIERFQQLVGLSLTEYSIDDAIYALKLCLILRAYTRYPSLEPVWSNATEGMEDLNRNDNHYLCLVNNTQWPVCVFSGLGAKFVLKTNPYQSIVRPSVPHSYFSSQNSYGYFVVGETCEQIKQMKNVQYIKFTIYNPSAIASLFWNNSILTQPVDSYDPGATYNSLQTEYDRAKSFRYMGQFCLVKGELIRGKNYTLFRFFIEEFNHDKLVKATKAQKPYSTLYH